MSRIVARQLALAVKIDERVEIGLAERVAVEGEERPVDPLGRVADRAAGAERLLLDPVLERELAVAVAEVVLDLGRQVAARDDRPGDAEAAQVLEGVGELRPVDERQHVLSRPVGQRPQTGAEAADENDGRQAHAEGRPMLS